MSDVPVVVFGGRERGGGGSSDNGGLVEAASGVARPDVCVGQGSGHAL